MQVTNYKPFPKQSALKGTFDLVMPKWGGTMRRCKYFETEKGQKWVNMPDQEYEADGKKKYFQYWKFDTEEMKKAFDEKVVKLVQEEIKKHPQPAPAIFAESDNELPF